VEISDDCKTTWNVLGTFTSNDLPQNSQFTTKSTSLAAYNNKNVFFRFRLTGPHNSSYWFYLDDIGVINSINVDLGNDTTGCSGIGVTINDGYSANNYNHQWRMLGSQNVLSTDSFFTVNQSGYYVARVYDAYGNDDYDTIFVKIIPKPTAQFVTDTITICGQYPVNMGIVFSGKAPFVYGLFDDKSQTTTTDTAQSFYESFVKNVNATTLYKIVSLADSNGCVYNEDFDSLLVISNPLPTVSISGLASSYCADAQPVNITTTPSGGTLAGPGISGNMFYPSNALTGNNYIIYSYTDGNGCTNSDTNLVIVNSLPSVTINTNLNNSYCHDADSVVLSGSIGTFSGPGVTGNIFRPWLAPAGNVTITLSYTDEGGCTGMDSVTTTVYSLPIVTLSSFGSICANAAPLTLSGGSPSGGVYSGNAVAQGVFYPAIANTGSDTIHGVEGEHHEGP
jgi:hypothetical protein